MFDYQKKKKEHKEIILEPKQKVKYDDVYYILKKIDHQHNNAPIGMLWLCKEDTPTIAVGVVNIFTKTTRFGDMNNLISNVEDTDNLCRLYDYLYPPEIKKTTWQKFKSFLS